jgi:cell pole-organizing protein PopZ
MQTNPGIGFSIGSGGNGYRPSILIAVWTDQPFDTAAALATIKAHLNVPTNPVTTNGDCAIACDGTYQEQTPAPQPEVSSAPVQESAPVSEPAVEPSTETTPSAPEPPSSTPQPEQQIAQDNTQQYTLPIVTYETNAASYSSSVAPSNVAASITSKPIVDKVKITPKNIKSKKVKKVLIKSKQPIK